VRRARWILAAAVVAAVVGTAGATASDSQPATRSDAGVDRVLKAVAHLQGAARTRELSRLAAAEGGKLTVYTSLNGDLAQGLVDRFGRAFGIDVTLYRAADDDVVRKLREEASARYRGADAVETNGPQMVDLGKAKTLVPYASPLRPTLAKGTVYRYWTADRFQRIVVAWNTRLVSPRSAPRHWENLAESRWKGQVALELGDYDWYETLWRYWVVRKHKTPAKADKLFAAIAANGIAFSGHTLIGQLLAGGEFKIAASAYAHLIEGPRADGAPVAWRPAVQPVIIKPAGVGLVARGRHPAAALLYVDWLLGREGQKQYVRYHFEPVRSDLRKNRGVSELPIDLRYLSAHERIWRDRYDRLLARAKPGPTG
jgi:iron(III) transport system substrate-binding protein